MNVLYKVRHSKCAVTAFRRGDRGRGGRARPRAAGPRAARAVRAAPAPPPPPPRGAHSPLSCTCPSGPLGTASTRASLDCTSPDGCVIRGNTRVARPVDTKLLDTSQLSDKSGHIARSPGADASLHPRRICGHLPPGASHREQIGCRTSLQIYHC